MAGFVEEGGLSTADNGQMFGGQLRKATRLPASNIGSTARPIATVFGFFIP